MRRVFSVFIFLFLLLLVSNSLAFGTERISDLCPGEYQGYSGCLYPNSNLPPVEYVDAAVEQLVNDNNLIVLSLGMSMMQNASTGFTEYTSGITPSGTVNPALKFFNGAIGSKQQNWEQSGSSVWNRGVQILAQAGYAPSDVDVVLYHNAWAGASAPFPDHAINMLNSLKITMGLIQDKYPNIKLIMVTNRHYAYAPDSKHPEPYAYEEAFSWKWLVEDRMACTTCDVPIVWFADEWYLDWNAHPEYYLADGLHLSPAGQAASADVWYQYWSSLFYIAPWYLPDGQSEPTATPAATPAATVTPTPTPTCFYSHCVYMPQVGYGFSN